MGSGPISLYTLNKKKNGLKHHREALGQLSNRFSDTMNQQLERAFVIGAVASDSEIELVAVNRVFFFLSYLIL